MQFLQKPDTFCFTSGLGNIVISPGGNAPVTFSIRMGNTDVLPSETYYRDNNGVITIAGIGDVLSAWLRDKIALAYLLDQQISMAQFTFIYNDTIRHTHTVMRCDIDFDVTAAVFCRGWFLNLMFGPKKTTTARRETLAYYDDNNENMLQAVITATYLHNDRLVTDTFTRTALTSDLCPVKYINASAAQFEKSGCKLLWYEVQAGSRTQRYEIDYAVYLQETHFVYRNAFGVEDTFSCVGESSSEGKYERYYATYSGGYKNYKRKNLREYSVNTGHLSQAAAYCLDDVFASEEIWMYDESGLIKEIVILDQTVKRSSLPDELPAYEFSYRLTQTNQRYKTAIGGRIFDATFDRSFE